MEVIKKSESPMRINISFNKLLEHYEDLAANSDEFIAKKAKRVLKTAAALPILRDGFTDLKLLEKYKNEKKYCEIIYLIILSIITIILLFLLILKLYKN